MLSKPQKAKMHQILHLQHHRHTGKLLHHRHTSYRGLAVILVLAAVLMGYVQWNFQQIVSADAYIVTATVPAPVPSTPAVIIQPAEGTITHNPDIIVGGTCPVESPAVSVVIYSNGTLLGSIPCGASGNFTIQVTIFAGSNQLTARTLTITGDYGPTGTPVNVTFSPSSTTGGDLTGTPGIHPATAPLTIHSDKEYLVFGPSVPAEWVGTISGGQPPYTVNVNWGDHVVSVEKNLGTETHRFSHLYTSMLPHVIRVTSTDAANNKATATYAALTSYVAPTIGNVFRSGNGANLQTMVGAYGAYVLVLSSFGGLWIGAHALGYTHITIQASHRPNLSSKRRH